MNTDNADRFASDLRAILASVQEVLIAKNGAYGDSALSPVRIFARDTDVWTGLAVRIDDKLSRIRTTGLHDATEDTLRDLVGYLLIVMILRARALRNLQERAVSAANTTPQSGFYPPITPPPGYPPLG